MRRVTSTAPSATGYASSSLRELTQAFRDASPPSLDLLVGVHQATRLGPFWMRRPASPFLAATGMPGWWGKEFMPATTDDGTLLGHNLREAGGRVVPSLPMTGRVAASRVDDRPALVLTYDGDARWPWRGVTDELRPVADGVLLGLSFDIVARVPVAVPFLLERR